MRTLLLYAFIIGWLSPICLQAQDQNIGNVAFSPNGKQILMGSTQGKVAKLWDIKNGKLIKKFKSKAGFSSVAFSPDGKQILLGEYAGFGKNVHWIDIKQSKTLARFEAGSEGISFVQFSADGKKAIIGNPGDYNIGIWQLPKVKCIHNPQVLYGDDKLIDFSANGQKIAVASYHELSLFEMGSQKKPTSVKLDKKLTPQAISLSPNDKLLFVGIDNGQLQIRDAVTLKLTRNIKAHDKGITCLAVSPNGKYVVTGAADQQVKLWDIGTGKLLHNFTGHRRTLTQVSFSPNGKQILSFATKGVAQLWNTKNGKLIRNYRKDKSEGLLFAKLSPNGKQIVTCGYNAEKAQLWSVKSGKLLGEFK